MRNTIAWSRCRLAWNAVPSDRSTIHITSVSVRAAPASTSLLAMDIVQTGGSGSDGGAPARRGMLESPA